MNALIFGSTGAAGRTVLKACLAAPDITEVRAVTRRPLEQQDPRLVNIIHTDYLNYEPIAEAFEGIDTLLFCLGKSVLQVDSEEEYRRITYDFAMAAARMMKERSPGACYNYLSGAGTDVNGRQMWRRVKGEAERDLRELVNANAWRPGFINAPPSQSSPKLYVIFFPLFRLLKPFRSLYVDGEELGHAMLHAAREGIRGETFENREIRGLLR